MAKFELKFIDCVQEESYIKVNAFDSDNKEIKKFDVISINGISDDGNDFAIWLDKSTAIKFAKTLRTEINKITESEVSNG